MRKIVLIIMILFHAGAILAQQEKTPKIWSLEDCITYAIKNNITVKQAELTQNSAEINYKQSKYERLPSVSANASQSMNNGRSIDPITSSYVSQLINSTSAGINASMTLFKGNYINNTIKQNDLLVKQNELFVSEAKNSVLLGVAQAYLQALYYKEGIEVAKNVIVSSQEQLKQMSTKYKAGSAAGIDEANLETQLKNDEVTLITAQNNYRLQLITLKQLLELDPNESFDIVPTKLTADQYLIPDLKTVYNYAVSNLPEIKSASLQTSIKELELSKAKSGYLPTLSLTAGLNSGYTNTQNYGFLNQFDNNFYQSAGLSLSIPIFSKYQNKANVANAKIEIENSKLSAVSENKQLYLKIENAWQNANSSQSQIEAAAALKNSSKLAYDMSIKKSELGALSSTDLLVSKNTYLNAEQTYLQAKLSLALYYQLLQFYQGNQIKI
ncbi:TolC family protein [Flavobacterium pectinovorum]|uniref:TolC family protein n=1 Tax=Flavobacterium pectinovorum TaxID=29533 RepID=UPI00265D7888|nr:TolC family protein [Flavobacterium pectinovorum]WKL49791.1 TolC family protein [Flavobacterium pectinovorum]